MGILIAGAIIFALLVGLKNLFGSGGAKSGDTFVCPGYGRRSSHKARHNNRSSKASGTPYCNSCHAAWLKDNPQGKGGCSLIVFLMFALAAGALVAKFA